MTKKFILLLGQEESILNHFKSNGFTLKDIIIFETAYNNLFFQIYSTLFVKQFREIDVKSTESNHATLQRQISFAGEHYTVDQKSSQVLIMFEGKFDNYNPELNSCLHAYLV